MTKSCCVACFLLHLGSKMSVKHFVGLIKHKAKMIVVLFLTALIPSALKIRDLIFIMFLLSVSRLFQCRKCEIMYWHALKTRTV